MPRKDPLEVAVRALRHRDLSAAALAAKLAQAGVGDGDREDALATLARVGYVDDGRFALRRAETLAERGWGNAGILADLERQGVPAASAAEAIAALPPERERAARVFDRRGPGARTAAYLVRRGFGDDAVEAAVARMESGELG